MILKIVAFLVGLVLLTLPPPWDISAAVPAFAWWYFSRPTSSSA